MSTCSVRTYGECACEPTECRAAKPKPLAAELMLVPVKTQITVCLFLGVIAGIVAFAIAARAEPVLKAQDIANQEVTHHAHRR